jgi:ribosomal protein S11
MATKANIFIDQGSTFSTIVTITDNNGDAIDLTNFTGAGQMRKSYTASTAYNFTVNVGNTAGTITLSMTANTTANIAGGRYLYDVELTGASGVISRVLEGIATVNPNITR